MTNSVQSYGYTVNYAAAFQVAWNEPATTFCPYIQANWSPFVQNAALTMAREVMQSKDVLFRAWAALAAAQGPAAPPAAQPQPQNGASGFQQATLARAQHQGLQDRAGHGGRKARAGTASGAGTSQAVQEVAQVMARYNYQFYYNDRKSNQATRSQGKGNCVDLAQVAVEEFQKRGIQARVVRGQMNSKRYNGGHAWVNFMDPGTHRWTFFDPVAETRRHDPSAGFRGIQGARYSGSGVHP